MRLTTPKTWLVMVAEAWAIVKTCFNMMLSHSHDNENTTMKGQQPVWRAIHNQHWMTLIHRDTIEDSLHNFLRSWNSPLLYLGCWKEVYLHPLPHPRARWPFVYLIDHEQLSQTTRQWAASGLSSSGFCSSLTRLRSTAVMLPSDARDLLNSFTLCPLKRAKMPGPKSTCFSK